MQGSGLTSGRAEAGNAMQIDRRTVVVAVLAESRKGLRATEWAGLQKIAVRVQKRAEANERAVQAFVGK